MNGLLVAMICLAAPGVAPDVAVVCPEAFVPALTPWIAYRQSQGHEIALVSNRGGAEQIRGRIRQLARRGGLRFVLLVGDADPNASEGERPRLVPAHLAEARVSVRYGSEPQIATDNWYADLDDDRLPDLALGRLTADTPEELARIVRKILDYERQSGFGLWRRRINFIAGVGGFGAWTDAILETATKKLIADGVPPGYATSMTYASWRSPYCPDPRSFAEATRERLNEGCLFWVYLGHGHRRSLDWLHVPEAAYRIFDVRDVPELACRRGSPIALFLACYAGAFDGPRDCLAEALLAEPEAPVAVIAGSRVTMPYAMAVLGTSLLEQCFVQKRETLGEALLAAKRQMAASAARQSSNRQLLDLLASVLSPSADLLAAERLEHVQLFNLLGDPLLRLRYPQRVDVQAPAKARAGGQLVVEGTSPVAGQCVVELVVRRGRLTFDPPARPEYDPRGAALAAMGEVYRKANDPRLAVRRFAVERGKFRVALDVPEDAAGACRARVFVQGQESHAIGAAEVEIMAQGTAPN
jgi:hypothetical protein